MTSKGYALCIQLILGGVLNFMYDFILGHALEFIKVAMQTQQYGNSYWDIFIKIVYQPKGISGLLDGFFPWGAIQALGKGAAFSFSHAVASTLLQNIWPKGNDFIMSMVAGGVGGFFQGLVLSPLLLLKTKVMTDKTFRASNSIYETSIKASSLGYRIITDGGLSALMEGSLLFSIKRFFDWTTRYMFVGYLEICLIRYYSWKGKGNLRSFDIFACFLIGCIMSTLITMPLDFAVLQIQKSNNSIQEVKASWTDEKQWQNMTRGFYARALHVVFSTLVLRQCVPLVYNWLFPQYLELNMSKKKRV